VPAPTLVGKTLVTNAGSHGKFVAVLDLKAGSGGVSGYRYRLLPVFSNLLPADAEMQSYIDKVRAPYRDELSRKLALTEGLLYRRGNFNGSFDEVMLDALMAVKGAEIAFSPGFRWGPTLLPGDAITVEDLMGQTAITYPQTTVNEFTGDQIKAILEDIADNLFNPDPYLQQGGDMVRVGGLTYAFDPHAPMGARVFDLRVKDLPIKGSRRYKVAGWAPVSEGVTGEPIWDVVERWLRDRKTVQARAPFMPRLVGVKDNAGLE